MWICPNAPSLTRREGKGTVNVTVPVQVYRKVNFTYQLENVPEYYQGVTNFFTLSPTYIEFWGSPTAVESFAAQVADWANSILTT